MAFPEKYEGPGSVMMNGSLLAEAQNVRVNYNANNNKVRTMKRGLAGRSKGPRETEISVSSAVPVAGLEQEFIEYMVKDQNIRLVIPFGGRRYQFDGWLESVSHTQDTDSAASIEFTMTAGGPQML